MKLRQLALVFLVVTVGCLGACTSTNHEVRKKQAQASRELGEAFLKQGNYTKALREFIKAEKLYNNDHFLHDDLGLTYMAKGRLDLVIEHFKQALKIAPDYAAGRNNLATAYLKKKEWDTAIKHLKEVTQDLLYATPQFPLSNLGWAYYNKGEYELAVKYYKEALELDARLLTALRGLGLTYIAMGKGSEAAKILESGVKNYPRVAQLRFDLGEAYTLSGEYKKAFNAFRRVAELVPDTPLARKAQIEAQKIKAFKY